MRQEIYKDTKAERGEGSEKTKPAATWRKRQQPYPRKKTESSLANAGDSEQKAGGGKN